MRMTPQHLPDDGLIGCILDFYFVFKVIKINVVFFAMFHLVNCSCTFLINYL